MAEFCSIASWGPCPVIGMDVDPRLSPSPSLTRRGMDPVLLNVVTVSLKAASQRGEVLVRYTTSQWGAHLPLRIYE